LKICLASWTCTSAHMVLKTRCETLWSLLQVLATLRYVEGCDLDHIVLLSHLEEKNICNLPNYGIIDNESSLPSHNVFLGLCANWNIHMYVHV
jgi:hypothetical protein